MLVSCILTKMRRCVPSELRKQLSVGRFPFRFGSDSMHIFSSEDKNQSRVKEGQTTHLPGFWIGAGCQDVVQYLNVKAESKNAYKPGMVLTPALVFNNGL